MGIYNLITKNELFPELKNKVTEIKNEDVDDSISNFDKLINNVPYGILNTFKMTLPDLKADKTMWKTLRQLNNEFVTRNDDHVRFLGSNLLGCYPLKFIPAIDRVNWFSKVLGVDETTIKKALLKDRLIYPQWKLNCDVFSLSVTYVIHLLFKTEELNDKQKEESIINAYRQLYYRYIGSWISQHFQYPCSYENALTTYNSLSKRFDIKIYGNWANLIKGKIELAMQPNSVHYNTFVEYKDAASIFYINRDTSTRIKAVLSWIYDRHKTLAESSAGRVVTSEDSILIGSDVVLRDSTKMFDIYYNYTRNILNTKSFIKMEIVDVILEVMNKARRDYFITTLEYINMNYGKNKFKHIDEFVKLDLQYAFEIIHYNNLTFTNVRDVVAKLRSKFMAPKGSDEELLTLRTEGEALVDEATEVGKYTSYSPSAERTSIMLYLVVRSLCMKYYS